MPENEYTFIPPQGCSTPETCEGYQACIEVDRFGEALGVVDRNPRFLLTTYENSNCPAARETRSATKLVVDRLRREDKLPH